jgi:tetratricopeptide (TPR) repeat protein
LEERWFLDFIKQTIFILAFFGRTADKYGHAMIRRWCALCLTAVLALSVAGHAQTSPAHIPAKNDYSQEAAIIEETSTKIAFDNDGKLTHEQTSRVRVQTDAGVQQWGLLIFPFQSATQTVEIDYVRVHKPDGSIQITPPNNVQDLDAEITRSAPFYSDLREKHVAVKGLGKGDILEYQAHWHAIKPLVPGQFWYQYNFHHEGIVLNERLEIKVPADRAVKVKGPQATQIITNEPGFRVYSWTYSRLESAKEPGSEEKKATDAARGRNPSPDVQISSFQSWEEVGRWYWDLQKDRVEPSAAVRAKAAELTKGMNDNAEKLLAIYSFVSTQYRYIGIAFGIGRYQPHTADDVLSNNYGDCKDKHTLLASLLQASGITLYPALIGSSWKLDPDIPSPGQFDHIIGYLPMGKDGLWLDTTAEVSPLGYLVTPLRDKQALVMPGDKPAQLKTTPLDPPFESSQTFTIEGKLSENGTFDAKVEDTVTGEREVPMRLAFRRVPQSQWKDLMQQISYGLGFAGTVSEVTASTPEMVTEPFHFTYSYNRKDYPDWSNHQFTVPGLPFLMPPLRDDASDPIWLGSPQETISDSKVEVPKGYEPQVPASVDLKYDFAEYHASYSVVHSVLTTKRSFRVKQHEVPVAEFEDYRSFVKNLQNDVNQYVQTSSSTVPFHLNPQAIPNGSLIPDDSSVARLRSFMNGIVELPPSTSSDANRSEADGRNALGLGDRSAAMTAFKRAVESDPKFTRAWLLLGIVYMTLEQSDSALDVFRKAIDSDPKQVVPRRTYAIALEHLRRADAAMDAWREVLKISPDEPRANAELGSMLVQQKRYSEAVPYLETAAKSDPSPASQNLLGIAYLQAGQIDRGTSILEKLVAPDAKPEILNDIGYELAEANASLLKALEYAQQAVDKQEKESLDVKLSNLLPEDLKCTQKIGMFWDTLGWVHFRLGNLDQAERYINAAWLLSQSGIVADHLGQVYEQQQEKQKAIHMYRLALAGLGGRAFGDAGEETRHRLEHLTGTKTPTMPLRRGDSSGSELSQLRSVKLNRLIAGSATAEFFLLFSPGPIVEDVQFISGSEKLKSAGDSLSKAKFQVTFPEGSSAHLVRRAILTCSSVSGCEAVLLIPDSVDSVK